MKKDQEFKLPPQLGLLHQVLNTMVEWHCAEEQFEAAIADLCYFNFLRDWVAGQV